MECTGKSDSENSNGGNALSIARSMWGFPWAQTYVEVTNIRLETIELRLSVNDPVLLEKQSTLN